MVSQRAELTESAQERLRKFEAQLDLHIDSLRSMRDFMMASPATDRADFALFSQGALRRGTAFQSVQWIPLVADAEREEYETAALAEGYEEFAFFQRDEDGERVAREPAGEYYPVYYDEPAGRGATLLGLDLSSTQVHHEALLQAKRERGLVAVATPGQPEEGGSEFSFFLPVFSAPGESGELTGFVSAVLDISALGAEVFDAGRMAAMRVELLEERPGEEGRVSLFSIGEVADGPRLKRVETPISIGGREWRLRVVGDGSSLASRGERLQNWTILGLGLTLTGFVALWIRQGQVYVQSVEGQVAERTAALSRINEDLEREIEQRREAEKNFVESEIRFREAFLHAPIGIALVSPTGFWMQVNQALTAMTGFSEEELLSKSLVEMLHPDDMEVELARMGQLLAGEIKTFALEQRFRHQSGDFLWVLLNVSQVRADDNRLLYLVCQILDVTDRKRALEETSKAHQRLEEFTEVLRQRNKELQDFAYVASHDLQEPLRKIGAFGNRLEKKCEGLLDDQAKDYLARMLDAARRMQNLISDLLAFSRVTTGENHLEQVDLSVVVREVLSDLETRIEESQAEIEVGPLPVLEASATQMRQLIQNLVGNGLKYQRPEVPPRLRIHTAEWREDAGLPPLPEGGFLLCVEDNGIGFDEKYLDRIFTVFQRLHGRNEYAGTGVGLAISRRIAERHHGWITARSPGEGATFIVGLPVKQPTSP